MIVINTLKDRLKEIKKGRYLYLMFLPALLFYLIFCYVPMYGLTVAFKDYNIFKGIVGSDWIGTEHMIEVLKDELFWKATRNTVIISICKIIFSFPAPIIIALLLNEMKSLKYRRGIQTVIYLPHFLSWVIVGGIVLRFLSVDNGIINNILLSLGHDSVSFMSKKEYFRGLIILTDIWKNSGYSSIIYMAALTSINPELYEAATIDGANRLKQIIHVTLPSIRTTIMIMFLLAVSRMMYVGFDQVFVLKNPLVVETGEIIDTYVYRTGIEQGRFEYATFVGIFKGAIGYIMVVGVNKLSKVLYGEGII